MKYMPIINKRILAIDPATRGLGFAVIENDSLQLLDWGMKSCSSTKQSLCLDKAKGLIERYNPDTVILEDHEGDGSRRCRRVQKLIQKMIELAGEKKIKVRTFSRGQIRQAFAQSEAYNKYEIAQVIGNVYPELKPRMPRYREIWMNEDFRMNIFDAVALGMTYFHSAKN